MAVYSCGMALPSKCLKGKDDARHPLLHTHTHAQKHKLPADFADNQRSRWDDDNLERSLIRLRRWLTPLLCAFQGKAYAFDSVFPTNATQEQIYNASAKQIVKGELCTHTHRDARTHAHTRRLPRPLE